MEDDIEDEDEMIELLVAPFYYTDNGTSKWRKKDSIAGLIDTCRHRIKSGTIKEHDFCKKICAKYVPDPDNHGKCECGRERHKSCIDGIWTEHLGSDWEPRHHLIEEVTNAYGSLTFYGADRNTNSRYIRISDDSSTENVVDFMINRWKFGDATQLLISVIGSANGYVKNEAFETLFKRGLRKIAVSTHAWVITGGTNVGVMKLVGEALRDVSQLDSTCTEYNRVSRVMCIGIAPWGVIPNRQQLTCKNKSPRKLKLNAKFQRTNFLDHNHTHFLLVDNGSIGDFNAEVDFRNDLENFIMGNIRERVLSNRDVVSNVQDHSKAGAAKKIAAVKLVIGGGPETINHVYQTIINEIPVIVFKETSQAAALFAYAFELPPLEVCNLAEIEEHQKLIDMIGLEYPDLTRRQKAKYYNKIMKCMKQKKYISVFSLNNESGETMDSAILNAFLKTCEVENQQYVTFEQMMFAIKWNRADFVEMRLEKLNLSGDIGKDMIRELLIQAIIRNKPAVVQVLLDDLLELTDRSQILTDDDFVRMYQKRCNKKSLSVLHLVIKDLKNKANIQEEILDALTDFGDISEKNFSDDPMKHLFLFAVMCNMKEMAMLFLHYGEQILIEVLLACKMYRRMIDFYKDNTESQKREFLDSLNLKQSRFNELATHLLTRCTLRQELLTGRLLRQSALDYGSKTCLCLAASSEHVEFIAHETCQLILNDVIWHGRLKFTGNTPILHALQVTVCLFPPLFLMLDYKTRDMEQAEGKTKTEVSTNKLITKNSVNKRTDEGNKRVKIMQCLKASFYKAKYFYNAPIAKCASNVVSYCLFLAIFAYNITHTITKTIKPAEIVLLVYWCALLLEEIRQVIQAPVGRKMSQKIHQYRTSKWNILDASALLLFLIAFSFRLNDDTLIEARVLFAIDIFLWIIRLLHVFSISKQLGPYLVMINRMTIDLVYFVFVLAIFLFAYGISRFAIISPYNDSTMEAIKTVLAVPYKQMYADSLDDATIQAPENLTVFTFNYTGTVQPALKVSMAGYTLLAAVLLINLLIARFSAIYERVQFKAEKIWKYNRYYLIEEYQNKSAIPMPFSIIPNIYVICRRLFGCCRVPEEQYILSVDDKNELEGFERESLIHCLANTSADHICLKEDQAIRKKHEYANQDDEEENGRPITFANDNSNQNDRTGSTCYKPPSLSSVKTILYYPLTAKKRFVVPKEYLSWEIEYPEYEPEEVPSFFDAPDADQTAYRNPNGRTGFVGNGLLPAYGENTVVEAIITRWKHGLMGIEEGESGSNMLQVLVVCNNKLSKITIPSGPQATWISSSSGMPSCIPLVLYKLFQSESLNDPGLWLSRTRKAAYTNNIDDMIDAGQEIFSGYVDDPRNTDNAWIGSYVATYHDDIGDNVSKYLQSENAKELNLVWLDVSENMMLPKRQLGYLRNIAAKYDAHF